MRNAGRGWRFVDDKGTFTMEQPDGSSYLYFPLVNEANMMSTITPTANGHATSGQHTFLMTPLSAEDLHNNRATRNFWVSIDGEENPWSAVGVSAVQLSKRFRDPGDESLRLDAGFLWHRLTRENRRLGLRAVVTNFVPSTSHQVELMRVELTNTGTVARRLTPTVAIPLYGRSAGDIRDHRHVTSLLHRTYTTVHGVEVQPTLSFDERGHRVNRTSYAVFAVDDAGASPYGFTPLVEDFIGEGGTLDWPTAVVRRLAPTNRAGERFDGYETIAALHFSPFDLAPSSSKSFIICMVISEAGRTNEEDIMQRYGSQAAFADQLAKNEEYWTNKLASVSFSTGDPDRNRWMRWVTLQPYLRRFYGNSFLPYHDYGKGGRGWRDLWQDSLALLVMDPSEVGYLLHEYFAGVRADGSNATIIGSKPGEFLADRNNISRVWMDHGAWPFLTTAFYIHQSGDIGFLLREQAYFKDRQIRRAEAIDDRWCEAHGTALCTVDGGVYQGTILEHILVQSLVPFFNVGEHNIMKLEDADWNDGLDMASERGESVAFTALYGSNMRRLADMLRVLSDRTAVNTVELMSELAGLLDRVTGIPVDYDSAPAKRARLDEYLCTTDRAVSGHKIIVGIDSLIADLTVKSNWIATHLQKHEFITSKGGHQWFNGYYDNDGGRVEGDKGDGVRMTLTGQVFPIMGSIATDEQVAKVAAAVDAYLLDPNIGYRLNTNFGDVQLNLGRAFGFAFGHKENGSMFSHMAVMYANALYQRGFAREGSAVLQSIYSLCMDFENSRIYPGIPEYINARGRGMYPYLTGSASWLLLTLLTEVFGVKGDYGDLSFTPRLMSAEFDDEGSASVSTMFAGRKFHVVYRNPKHKEYGEYQMGTVTVDGRDVDVKRQGKSVVLTRRDLEALDGDGVHEVVVLLE